MHDVCSPQETCVFREDAVTNEETCVNIQPVAPNDDMFRNTLAMTIPRMTMVFPGCYAM